MVAVKLIDRKLLNKYIESEIVNHALTVKKNQACIMVGPKPCVQAFPCEAAPSVAQQRQQ